MSVREVPRSFLYECDACGEEHKQENPSGHYTDSRPPGWTTLKFAADVATGHVSEVRREEKLLCLECGRKVVEVIDRTLRQLNPRPREG